MRDFRFLRSWASASLLWVAAASSAAADEPSRPPRPRGERSLAGFRLELRPQLEDVFPDAAEYQRTLDRAAELSTSMRRVSDEFARAVQESLREVNVLSPTVAGAGKGCPAQVAQSYARAQGLGEDYLRIGREMARHHEKVRELDRLGDTAALTPDYRARVQKVLRGYEALLSDYREMKATFHDQLTDELRFAGCNLGPQQVAQAAAPGKDAPGKDAGKDAPGRDARPAKATATAASATAEARGNILFYVDNSRCRRGHRVLLDGQLLGEVGGESRSGFRATAGPHDLCLLSQPDPPGTRVATLSASPPTASAPAAAVGEVGGRDAGAQAPGEGDAPPPEPAAGAGGPSGQRCGDAGTVRRSYFHEGWTIALRCE